MRARLFFAVASIGACVGIAAACSSFTGDSTAGDAGDAGDVGDAGLVEAASDSGKLPPTPGQIECFGATCSTIASEACCFDPDAGTTQCASSCRLGVVPLNCDEKSDCAPGQICCVGFFGNADCRAKCTGERLCHSDDECVAGTTCVALPCRGSVIGACGPVGPYVKAFCDPHDQ